MKEMTVLTDAFAPGLDCFEVFKADDHCGYFYIVEYSNGLVKIGSTRNPKTRIQSLHYSAPIYAAGAETQRVAISAPHTLFRVSEVRLHEKLAEFRVMGTELFKMPFELALNQCNAYSAVITQYQSISRKYTAEALANAEKFALLLDGLPNDKRKMVTLAVNSFIAGMEQGGLLGKT